MRSPYRLGLFLLSNYVSRREIRAKQNSPLGGPEPLADRSDLVSPLTTATPVGNGEHRST
jgi:hypothetical protein